MDKRTDKDLELIRRTIDNSQFRESLESLLIDILSVDTSPEQQLEELSRCENLVFNKISEYLDSLTNLKGSRSRHPIADNIEEHPFYSKIFPFPDRQETPADIVYAGRNNLIYSCRPVHEKRGRNVGLNAHIDVVSPYFPPSRKDLHIKGRGSTDDKGNVVAILGALKVLDELIGNGNVELSSSVLAMFVIDEEIGGNGSLSLAMDHDLKKENYDSLLIMECASNNIFPGNRGAVFVKIDGAVSSELIASKACNVSVILETYSFGLVSLIDEGLKIKRESFHEQFPQNPVYTCTGILGNFGKHPSGICDYIEFSYRCSTKGVASIVEEAIQKGLAKYIDIFGDKRNTLDSLTGLPKILTHYEIRVEDTDLYVVSVYGSGGHMGSLPENDAAISKWAYIVKELTIINHRDGLGLDLSMSGLEMTSELTFEGAQSFLPCHKMVNVIRRMEDAFYRGVAQYQSTTTATECDIAWTVSFDKLHNEAFAIDPDSESVRNAIIAAMEAGIMTEGQDLIGWDASCDARIFALEYPDLPVITTGPGDLNGAHSDKEVLYLPDLYSSILFAVRYILEETKSVISY